MKKIAAILSIVGLIGILGIFGFSGTNLSLIIPLLPIIISFKSLFLAGILLYISTYNENNKLKPISIALFLMGTLASILSVSSLIPLDFYKVELALIISSFVLMIGNCFQGTIKTLIFLLLIFPILLVLGLNNQITSSLSIVYILVVSIVGTLKVIRN